MTMSYYIKIRSSNDYAKKVPTTNWKEPSRSASHDASDQELHVLTFRDFTKKNGRNTVNKWGSEGLFACRTLCGVEKPELDILEVALAEEEGYGLPSREHASAAFWPGQENICDKSEDEARAVAPDELIAQFWLALRPFLRADRGGTDLEEEDPTDTTQAPSTCRPQRATQRPEQYGDFQSSPGLSDSSDSSVTVSDESVGYTEKLSVGITEAYSLHLLGVFTRAVFGYGKSRTENHFELREDHKRYCSAQWD